MSKEPNEPKRARRPKARTSEIVFGAIDERMAMLDETFPDGIHTKRLRELIDELRRATNGKAEEAE